MNDYKKEKRIVERDTTSFYAKKLISSGDLLFANSKFSSCKLQHKDKILFRSFIQILKYKLQIFT